MAQLGNVNPSRKRANITCDLGSNKFHQVPPWNKNFGKALCGAKHFHITGVSKKNELKTQGNIYSVDGLSSLRKVRFKPKVQNSNLKLRNFIIFDIKTQDGVKFFRKFYTRIEPHYFRQVFTKRFSDARNTPGVIGVLPRSFEKFRVILEIF